MLNITALMDDFCKNQPHLTSEHGLSYYIEYNGLRFLFDCGQSDMFLHNAHALNVNLCDLDGVILSHSHYDHARGYRSLLSSGKGSSVLYTGPGFFVPKFALKNGQIPDLSCGFSPEFLTEYSVSHREISGVQQVHPGVWLISGFPRVHNFETIPERFLLKAENDFSHDDFRDEVCMVLEVTNGLAVLVGCSHPGILNILTHVRKTLQKPIRAVFGGTHLVEADIHRIEATITALQNMGVETLGLGHCTGDIAYAALQARPELQTCHLCTGDQISFL